jgi:glycine/sarcosine N-methyltransferase
MSAVQRYCDDLAPYYSLIYDEWQAAVTRQAAWLDGLIKERCVDATRILDVACGIGTQAIGLAKLGYAVTANDISAAAVQEQRTSWSI